MHAIPEQEHETTWSFREILAHEHKNCQELVFSPLSGEWHEGLDSEDRSRTERYDSTMPSNTPKEQKAMSLLHALSVSKAPFGGADGEKGDCLERQS
jgi:hypothetical protein